MTEHLWPFLRLRAATDEALVEAYRRVYIETYVRTSDGKVVELFDWMGNKVLFNPRTFDHAFSESTDYRFGGGSHDGCSSANTLIKIFLKISSHYVRQQILATIRIFWIFLLSKY